MRHIFEILFIELIIVDFVLYLIRGVCQW